MPRLSENERNQALGMLIVGATKQHVANAFGCSVSIVKRIAQRLQATESVRDRPRPKYIIEVKTFINHVTNFH